MEKETLAKANEIMEDIKWLEKYRELLKTSPAEITKLEIKRHFGDYSFDSDSVVIPWNHNDRFLREANNIILELESKLKDL